MPLDELLRGIWRLGWWVFLLSLAIFGAGAATIVLWPRSYVAQAVVAPLETTGIATSTMLAVAPLLQGGLLDNRPGGNFAVYLDAIRSPEATAMLVRDTSLMDHLTELRAAGPIGALRRHFDLRIAADLDDAQDWLERHLSLTQSVATVTFTLELSHRDRDAAVDMLQRLHAFGEAKVRRDLTEMTRRRIAAIETRLRQENDLYLRNALYDQLATHQRFSLVLGVDESVAGRLVSAPMVELKPSIPNRPLLLLLLFLVAPMTALIAAAALVLLRPPPRRARAALFPAEAD
jgi:hypothetical protein